MDHKHYKELLEKIIRKAGLDYNDNKDKLLTVDIVNQFEICFTHASVNREKGQNYENMEFLGDALYGTVINILFFEVYGNRFNERTYTFIHKNYGSKHHLEPIVNNLFDTSLIKFDQKNATKYEHLNMKVKTDVLEAIFYFLYEITNKYIQNGLGFLAVRNFICDIFYQGKLFKLTDEDIKNLKDSRTKLKELGDILKMNKKNNTRISNH